MNKKAAVTVVAFILVFMFLAVIMGLSEHIPFIGKVIATIIALIIIAFVILLFAIISGKRK